jgi:hypothetical protein
MLTFASLYKLDPELLEHTIMNRLYAIKLIADSTDDPNMIFESLNTKGRDLQQVDLIKNFLYLSLKADAGTVYRSYWRPIESVLRPSELEKYAWAWEVSNGENVLQKRTYEAVQRRLRSAPVENVKAYVAALNSEATWYERLIRPTKENDQVARTAIRDVLAAGGTTALPLLLYCYRQWQTGEASKKEFRDALRAIESFLVRRMLAGEPTNNLNSMFGIMCSRLHNDPKFRAGDDLLTDVRRVLSSRPDDWPTDEQVLIGIQTKDFYHAQTTKQRIHVLRRLDEHFNASHVALNYEESDKSIEHIAPQDQEAPWWVGSMTSVEWEEVWGRRDALCNLTLLTPGDNSSLGHAGWPGKRARYAGYSYPLTARIAEQFDESGGWSSDRLDARADDLMEAASVVWTRDLVAERAVTFASPVPPASGTGTDEDDEDEEVFPDDDLGEMASLLDSEDVPAN